MQVMSLQKSEGAGNAGCALHPRSRVQSCAKKRTRAYRFSGNTPASPAQWLYGLCHALLGDEFVLSPSSADLSGFSIPVGLELPPPTWHQQRVSEPHGFAVRKKRRSSCSPLNRSRGSTRPATSMARRRSRVHHIPLRVRDDARPPLLPEQDGRTPATDLRLRESKFCPSCQFAATRRTIGWRFGPACKSKLRMAVDQTA